MRTYDAERPGTRNRLSVGVADRQVVADGQTLVAHGLGACVAVALYDPGAGAAGLTTVMLPERTDSTAGTARKFADPGIRETFERLTDRGAAADGVVGWLVGGSDVFDLAGLESGVGARTVETARAELDRLGVPVVDEATGGDWGRTVEFDTDEGAVTVTTAGGWIRRLDRPGGD